MKIVLGRTQTDEILEFTYEPYTSRGILINGITNSRKSSLLEELAKRFSKLNPRPNIIIVDVEGEFARLRRYHNDFIIVGKEGEIPIDQNYSLLLGELARTHNLDLILQIGDIETEKEREEFLAKFIKGLMRIEKKETNPCVFIMDEGQVFCSSRKTTKSRDSIVNLCQRGRKYGILPIIAVQGLNEFYKDARDQLENRIIGFHKNPNDRILSTELLNINRSMANVFLDLRNEPLGRFWCEGADITQTAAMFQLESVKHSQDEKYEIPPISQYGFKVVQQIIKELQQQTQFSTEIRLMMEITNLKTRLRNMHAGQPMPQSIEAIKQAAETKGWNDAVSHFREQLVKIGDNVKKNRFDIFHKIQYIPFVMGKVQNGETEKLILRPFEDKRGMRI